MDAEAKAHDRRARTKLFVSMLSTYGYALLAGGAWEPLSKAQAIGVRNLVTIAIAVAMHAFALYIAPEGETR